MQVLLPANLRVHGGMFVGCYWCGNTCSYNYSGGVFMDSCDVCSLRTNMRTLLFEEKGSLVLDAFCVNG
jgi:hypothetical protein